MIHDHGELHKLMMPFRVCWYWGSVPAGAQSASQLNRRSDASWRFMNYDVVMCTRCNTRCNALMVRMISDHFECVVPCSQPTRAVNIVVFERKKIVYMVHCGSAGNMPHVRLSKICRRCGVRHTCDVRNCIVSPIFTSLISETFPSKPFSISMLLIESSRA